MTLVEWSKTWSVEQSDRIARNLNKAGVGLCPHGKSPCYAMCGVERVDGMWKTIDELERWAWFGRIMGRVFAMNLKYGIHSNYQNSLEGTKP